MHSVPLDNFKVFKLLADSQKCSSRATEGNKICAFTFKRKCINLWS